MCGRYTQHMTWQEIHDLYSLTSVPVPPNSFGKNDNVAPTVAAPILIREDDEQKAVMARWWFQPDWAKSFDTKFNMFNARTDRLEKSKAYKPAFERGQRCLVPMSGFYEWVKQPDGSKQCTLIEVEEQAAYSMAGIFNRHSNMVARRNILGSVRAPVSAISSPVSSSPSKID